MKDTKNSFNFVWKYAKNKKKFLFLALFLSIISMSMMIITPIYSAKVIVALTDSELKQIIYLGLILMFINLVRDALNFAIKRTATILSRYTLQEMEIDIAKKILTIEKSVMDEKGTGSFIQRLTNDAPRLSEIFHSYLDSGTNILSCVGCMVAVFTVNKIVFIFVLCMLTYIFFFERLRTIRREEDDKHVRKEKEKLTSLISELVRGSNDIKMLNSEKGFVKEVNRRIDSTNQAQLDMQKRSHKYKLFIWSSHDIFKYFLIILLVYLMKNLGLAAATALVLYNYVNNLDWLPYELGYLLEYTKDLNLSCKRLMAIGDGDEFKKEKFGKKHLDKVEGNFEFKNVTFAYKNKKVLDNLNFKIKANTTVGFVGRSGSGKTTIFNLLIKMYNIKHGEILIDGINIKDLDKDSVRGNITVISQNPYIFNLSIRENLKICKPDLTEEEMIEACKVACLHDYIVDMKDGYDTIIGEGGVSLSGGQKQRLAIARALVQKTKIILFDEATSALDNETQEQIQQAIMNMKKDYTILIIAHRLSTIINCDKIMYLDKGKIIGSGTHEKLLKTLPEYTRLYNSEIKKRDTLENKMSKEKED